MLKTVMIWMVVFFPSIGSKEVLPSSSDTTSDKGDVSTIVNSRDSDLALLLQDWHIFTANTSKYSLIYNEKQSPSGLVWGDFVSSYQPHASLASSSPRPVTTLGNGLIHCPNFNSNKNGSHYNHNRDESCPQDIDTSFLRKWRANEDVHSDQQPLCEKDAYSKVPIHIC